MRARLGPIHVAVKARELNAGTGPARVRSGQIGPVPRPDAGPDRRLCISLIAGNRGQLFGHRLDSLQRRSISLQSAPIPAGPVSEHIFLIDNFRRNSLVWGFGPQVYLGSHVCEGYPGSGTTWSLDWPQARSHEYA